MPIPCAFDDNSRQLQENSLRQFAFVAFFDGCDMSCPIGKLPFSFLFVMNFLRRIFSVCHSFRSMCQSDRMKGFKRCFKVEDQGTWRRQNLHAAILQPPAKRIQIKLYEPHLGKEKPIMGNIEPLLGITKAAEVLNKPCQGNVNGGKSFAAEGFNVKIPFISKTYTKAVAISFRQSHTTTRSLVKYHPRVVFTESFHVIVSTHEEMCLPCVRENLIDIAKYRKNVIETKSHQDYR